MTLACGVPRRLRLTPRRKTNSGYILSRTHNLLGGNKYLLRIPKRCSEMASPVICRNDRSGSSVLQSACRNGVIVQVARPGPRFTVNRKRLVDTAIRHDPTG